MTEAKHPKCDLFRRSRNK